MNIKPDVSFIQVDCPDRKCSSGHIANEMFRRDGKDHPEEPTRFFDVVVKNKSMGTFCEPCLIMANYIKQQRLKGK